MMIEAFKYLRCLIFHRRWRYRTGERRILRVSITYEIRCRRCDNEDVEVQWVLPV